MSISRQIRKNDHSFWIYVAPILLNYIIFWFIPLIISIAFSFTNYTGLNVPEFIGFDNYINLVDDFTFIKSFKNTIIYMLVTAPGQTILGFLIAAYFYKSRDSKISQFVRWCVFIPSLASTSVLAIVIRIMLNNPDSPINFVITNLTGLEAGLLGNEKTAMIVLILSSILIKSGYYAIIFYSRLLDIPDSYIESAKIDGVNQLGIYKNILIPSILPMILLVLLLAALNAFQEFDLVYNLTGGGPGRAGTMTVMVFLYLNSFKYSRASYSMAIGNLMLIFALILSFGLRRISNKIKDNLY